MNGRPCLAWGVLVALTVAGVEGARAAQTWRRTHVPSVMQQEKSRGGAQPVLEFIEFSDFQCPACAQARVTLAALLARYPQQLRLQFRHHPLEKPHKWALTAALAAECAARQGQFWPYHDLLFARQQAWATSHDATAFFKGYAAELPLRQGAFDRCLDGQETLEAVRRDQEAGHAWGVKSTPTFVINGKVQIVGAQMLQQELPAIEARLKEGQQP